MKGLLLSRIITLIASMAGMSNQCIGQSSEWERPHATIHISAFDPFGQEVKSPQIYLYEFQRNWQLVKKTHDRTVKEIPYGDYLVVVTSSGGGMGRRLVVVNVPELWVRIGVAMTVGLQLRPGGNLIIEGRLIPSPKDGKDWWVRVQGVFLTESRESPVRNGKFLVAGLEMGAYVLQVFKGRELKHMQPIEIDLRRPKIEVIVPLK